ncbi:MAG: hypothetical protein WCP28_11845 [Actinomycetes bacterium]
MSDQTQSGSVVMQARVPQEIAQYVPDDTKVLGLDGQSDAIREGLRLLHQKAQLVALGMDYQHFYDSQPAPVSEITAALWGDGTE